MGVVGWSQERSEAAKTRCRVTTRSMGGPGPLPRLVYGLNTRPAPVEKVFHERPVGTPDSVVTRRPPVYQAGRKYPLYVDGFLHHSLENPADEQRDEGPRHGRQETETEENTTMQQKQQKRL